MAVFPHFFTKKSTFFSKKFENALEIKIASISHKIFFPHCFRPKFFVFLHFHFFQKEGKFEKCRFLYKNENEKPEMSSISRKIFFYDFFVKCETIRLFLRFFEFILTFFHNRNQIVRKLKKKSFLLKVKGKKKFTKSFY